MLKFPFRHAVLWACAWLALTPAAQAAEDKAAAEPAPPMPAAPFDRYQNFRDEPVADWRQANDRVNEAGGWRAYLREAHQDGNDAGQGRHPH